MARHHMTPEGPIPFTPEEEAEWDALEANADAVKAGLYQIMRAAEYPPVTDYLDGIVKGDDAQVQAYIAAYLAVKAKYPKPE